MTESPESSAPARDALLETFWEFLGRTTGVDEEVVKELGENHRKRWVPLTVVMMEERILEMSQVGVLLRKQMKEPGLRIGELAVREGFCTEDDVKRALAVQEEHCAHPVDLILGDDRIDTGAAVETLKSYVRHLEGRVETLQRQLDGESVIRLHRP